MKKLLAFLMAVLMVLGLVACATPPETPEQPEAPTPDPTENEIDLYLIAGQSNAAGHTKIEDLKAAYRYAPELENGFSNVLYAGNARGDNGIKVVNHDTDWVPARLGLGVPSGNTERIGPEAGMAKALAEYYNEESGKYAGIIKFAHGGTGLLNTKTGSNQFGNWVPPSYAAGKGIQWENDPVTGVLYRELLNTVREKVELLADYGEGFTKINIKGMYWMQGCNNRNNPGEYRRAFEFFARDLRRDLAALMTELTGSDCGASTMTICVGTISATFGLADGTTQANINEPFISMQKKLAERVDNCVVLDNSAYEMGEWNEATQSLEVYGSDKHHWNQEDMLEIGYKAGLLLADDKK
jgi:hypothetical protein